MATIYLFILIGTLSVISLIAVLDLRSRLAEKNQHIKSLLEFLERQSVSESQE